MNTGLSGIRIAPFFRRLLVLVVILLLIVVLLVFGSRIDAPSLREFASLRVERLVEHFHGLPRIRFAEQATWYARGHRRAGQHCEVNFATERSCQHLEDFFCFEQRNRATNSVGNHFRSYLRSIFFPFPQTTFESAHANFQSRIRIGKRAAPFSSLPNLHRSPANRSSVVPPDFRPLLCQDFSKIRPGCLRRGESQVTELDKQLLVFTVRRPDSFCPSNLQGEEACFESAVYRSHEVRCPSTDSPAFKSDWCAELGAQ